MGNLASLTFMLGANIKDFQTKLRTASQQMAKTGAKMKSTGKSMSMYATAPILALGGASLAAFDKQAQAENKLAAQIRSNGKSVEVTMESYKKFASELQSVTTVGDEVTLGLMQMAETMQSTNVEEATQGAISLSKALGVDLQAALKMTVLAQKGEYTMLNRYVPALRNASTETEKAAIVAKLYADGLDIAKAEAQTGLGPMKQLANTIGDITEQFGAIIAEGIKPMVDFLKKAADRFAGLSDRGKRMIVVVAAVVAAIGPMLIIFGSLAAILPTIAAGFALITGPVGLVVAAIAAIAAAFLYVYDNWLAFKERLTDWSWLRNAAIDTAIFLAKTMSLAFRGILMALGIDFVTPAIEYLNEFKTEVEDNKTEFKSFGASIKSVAKEVMGAMGLMGEESEKAFDKIEGGTKSTHYGFSRALMVVDKLKSSVIGLQTTIAKKGDLLPFNMDTLKRAESKMVQGIHAYEDNVSMAWEGMVDQMKGSINNMITSTAIMIGEAIGDMVSGLDPNFGNSFLKALAGFIKQIGAMMITFGTLVLTMKILEKTPSIPTAIAMIGVGIAAVAAAKAINNKLSKGPAKMAKGGIVPSGFGGDTYPALLSSGETVLPNPIPLGTMGGGNQNINVTGQVRMGMNEFLIMFDKATAKRERVRGF